MIGGEYGTCPDLKYCKFKFYGKRDSFQDLHLPKFVSQDHNVDELCQYVYFLKMLTILSYTIPEVGPEVGSKLQLQLQDQ